MWGMRILKMSLMLKLKMLLTKLMVNSSVKPKWQGGEMNVLIPMAGAGSRFETAGYTFPKPLIDVNGKPMIQFGGRKHQH